MLKSLKFMGFILLLGLCLVYWCGHWGLNSIGQIGLNQFNTQNEHHHVTIECIHGSIWQGRVQLDGVSLQAHDRTLRVDANNILLEFNLWSLMSQNPVVDQVTIFSLKGVWKYQPLDPTTHGHFSTLLRNFKEEHDQALYFNFTRIHTHDIRQKTFIKDMLLKSTAQGHIDQATLSVTPQPNQAKWKLSDLPIKVLSNLTRSKLSILLQRGAVDINIDLQPLLNHEQYLKSIWEIKTRGMKIGVLQEKPLKQIAQIISSISGATHPTTTIKKDLDMHFSIQLDLDAIVRGQFPWNDVGQALLENISSSYESSDVYQDLIETIKWFH